jgi:hypothetical protein
VDLLIWKKGDLWIRGFVDLEEHNARAFVDLSIRGFGGHGWKLPK